MHQLPNCPPAVFLKHRYYTFLIHAPSLIYVKVSNLALPSKIPFHILLYVIVYARMTSPKGSGRVLLLSWAVLRNHLNKYSICPSTNTTRSKENLCLHSLISSFGHVPCMAMTWFSFFFFLLTRIFPDPAPRKYKRLFSFFYLTALSPCTAPNQLEYNHPVVTRM